jgi:membrane protein
VPVLLLRRVPIPLTQIVRRTVREIGEDRCVGLAAQLAFYFFLALFPALLVLVALITYLPLDAALGEFIAALAAVAPSEALTLLEGQLEELARSGNSGILTLGIAGALWSSSAAMVAIIDALNHAYDVTEWRPWWKRRFVAILLTIALAVFIVLALAFIVLGPGLTSSIAERLGLARVVVVAWQVVRWPLIVAFVILGVDLVYYFAPNRKARWAWVTPGSALATILWIACSFAFKFYVEHVGQFNATYGTIGGIVVVLLWFYVSGFAILIGAELNGVIEQARGERL